MSHCLINQEACGREAGNPVCPKCGLDDRVVYPGEADREAAQERAEGRFWRAHSQELKRNLQLEERAAAYWRALANELQRDIEMEDKASSYWKTIALELQGKTSQGNGKTSGELIHTFKRATK